MIILKQASEEKLQDISCSSKNMTAVWWNNEVNKPAAVLGVTVLQIWEDLLIIFFVCGTGFI